MEPNTECGVHLDTKEQYNCGITSTEPRDEVRSGKDVATLQGAIMVADSKSSPEVEERAVWRSPSLAEWSN